MHRADQYVADLVEMAFIAGGFKPIKKTFATNGGGRCAIGAIAKGMDEAVPILGRSFTFCYGVTVGFDSFGEIWCLDYAERDLRMFQKRNGTKTADDFSRGFRCGYEIARRMFSKAKTERACSSVAVGANR